MTATPPLTASGRVGRRRTRLIVLLSVVGPGLLAGLSDDDPPGITTYSVLGTEYGYELLWVLLLSTVALIAFHSLGARMGVVTGQGLIGLIRDRYGPRWGGSAMALLLLANLGTTCAELAGVAAGFELFGLALSGGARGDHRSVCAGARRPFPSDRALSASPGGSLRGLYRGRFRGPSRLGAGRQRSTGAAYATNRRRDRDHHCHRRNHAGALGA